MAYSATYAAADTGKAVIDLVVTVFAAIASLGTLIGLVLLFKWMKGKGM